MKNVQKKKKNWGWSDGKYLVMMRFIFGQVSRNSLPRVEAFTDIKHFSTTFYHPGWLFQLFVQFFSNKTLKVGVSFVCLFQSDSVGVVVSGEGSQCFCLFGIWNLNQRRMTAGWWNETLLCDSLNQRRDMMSWIKAMAAERTSRTHPVWSLIVLIQYSPSLCWKHNSTFPVLRQSDDHNFGFKVTTNLTITRDEGKKACNNLACHFKRPRIQMLNPAHYPARLLVLSFSIWTPVYGTFKRSSSARELDQTRQQSVKSQGSWEQKRKQAADVLY